MEQFSEKELEILFDAMGNWESAPAKEGFNKALMGMMLPDQSKQEREEKMTQRMAGGDAESKTRQETSILIRAKIVHMKNIILSKVDK